MDSDPDTSTRASVDARASGRAAPDVTIASPPQDTHIYNFKMFQSIANELDFQEEKGRSRDGTKQMLLHGRNLPNENLKYQIFDLANHGTEYIL